VRAGNHYRRAFAETNSPGASGSKALMPEQAQHQQSTGATASVARCKALLMDADWISLLRQQRHSSRLNLQLPEQQHRQRRPTAQQYSESSCRVQWLTSLDNGRVRQLCLYWSQGRRACREGGLQAAATQRRSRCVAGCAHIEATSDADANSV
jgi:hypothetical protein